MARNTTRHAYAIKMPKPPKVRPIKPSNTPLIYYGGKSRDAEWIVAQFPPHETFVDVFGGGASIIFSKVPSAHDIYNDIGNVYNFFKCLRDHGDELYEKLYYTEWGTDNFQYCHRMWQVLSDQRLSGEPVDEIEWARCWYTQVIQSHTHEEMGTSHKHSKTNDVVRAWTNHVEELPYFADKLRRINIQNHDFLWILNNFDSEDTLFYLDPPYLPETRSSQDNYLHEMPLARHIEMLDKLNTIKGQAVVSMYSTSLYEEKLIGWRRLEKEHWSQIHQTSKNAISNGRQKRIEVLWIKERVHGLWSLETAQADMAGTQEN